VFKKETSVFKLWIPDDPKKYNGMAENDFFYWKVGDKLIKDIDDKEGVEDLIKLNYGVLKQVFMTIACKSSYPEIT
jgi:hypothetical protein